MNDIRVENSFIKIGYSNWKHARSTDKGFHQHEFLNQQAIQRLIEIPKSTEDVSEMIKSNSTEVKSQNRACLIKFISCLRYLARQGLPLRGHGNDQDSNFKQLLTCRAEDDPVFSEWLNRKNQNFTSPEIQNETLKETSLSILRIIVQSIKNAYFHSIKGLKLGIFLLKNSDNLSASLQTKDLCAAEAQAIAKHSVAILKKMRTDENCHLFWEDVKQKATKLDVDATKLSRKRRALTRTK